MYQKPGFVRVDVNVKDTFAEYLCYERFKPPIAGPDYDDISCYVVTEDYALYGLRINDVRVKINYEAYYNHCIANPRPAPYEI